MIVHPDQYTLTENGHKGYNKLYKIQLMESAIPWKKKVAKAFFRGAITGRSAQNGQRVDRSKLLWDSLDHKEHLEVNFNGVSDVTDEMPEEKIKVAKDFDFEYEINKYKYAIVIDGHVSSWGRSAHVLFS